MSSSTKIPRTRKRISIKDLKPGMCVVGLDQSWLRSPLWVHRQVIKSDDDIATLRRSGVCEVDIDGGGAPDDLPISDTADTESCSDRESPLSPVEETGSQSLEPRIDALPRNSDSTGKEASSFDNFDEGLNAAREIRLEAISAVEQVFEGIKTGLVLQSHCLDQVTRLLIDSLEEHEHGLLAEIQLQRMKQFDKSLFAHSVDVSVLALVVGLRTGLGEDELRILAVGSLLHDVGQIRLPRNLMTKNRIFNSGERRLFQSHPKLGATIIAESEGMPVGIRRIVSEHHERVDGKGYPWNRSGSGIYPLAQLVGLIDRYDALISNRGGRPLVPPTQAIRRLYQAGIEGEFAMEWVDRLIHSFGLFPIGSLVELTTGEQGWVINVNQADSMCPTVKVLWGAGHVPLAEPRIIELTDYQIDRGKIKVQRVLNPLDFGCTLGYTLKI